MALLKRALLSESTFLHALSLERKRAERSRRPFVLMLLDPGEPPRTNGSGPVLDPTVSALFSAIRETDVAGWYKDHSLLGVIFAELGPADMKAILAALQTKVTAALRSRLNAEELSRIHLSFHCFPEDRENNGTGFPASLKLYPDLAQRDEATKASRALKRAIDILGSGAALIVLAPIFLTIAAAIKFSSPGPILFRQKRIGQHGVAFTFLKFRSMHCANDSQIHMEYIKRFIAGDINPGKSESNGKVVYKITKDPRVTRVGGLLRKTSLDEFPQLLNVLRGEMSLVGPRPPIPYEVESYDIWHRRRLLEVKPGLTGLWQVNGRSRLRFDDMVRLDLKYATGWSLWMDVKILLQTPRAILFGDGAY
jgi:lipopolysaccharide/colanic/teichoic acid biosynthesis glycosyltransferase